MNQATILSTLLTFASIFLGGMLAVRYRNKLNLLEAFAGGVLISLALFELLPEALKLASTETSLLISVTGLILVGFVSLYLIENGASWPPRELVKNRETKNEKKGYLIVTELSIHGLLEGMAIGLGYGIDLKVGTIIAIAVICHEFSEGLATVTALLDSGSSMRASLSMLFIQAIAPGVGVLLTLFFTVPDYYLILSLPFFAGGFLYLGSFNLLPKRYKSYPLMPTIRYSLMGFIIILLLSIMT
jgi:ZIP family zinc transporter